MSHTTDIAGLGIGFRFADSVANDEETMLHIKHIIKPIAQHQTTVRAQDVFLGTHLNPEIPFSTLCCITVLEFAQMISMSVNQSPFLVLKSNRCAMMEMMDVTILHTGRYQHIKILVHYGGIVIVAVVE